MRSIPVLAFLVALLLTISGCATSQKALLTTCRAEGVSEDLRCGTVRVYENRDAHAGRTIDLNVVVVPAKSGATRAPLFELAGGPGLAATSGASFYVNDFPAYREHRDIVLVDQRGTGKSNALSCDGSQLTPSSGLFPEGYVRQCRATSEGHADLRYYTTDLAADDLEDVRRILGYPPIDLLATSYGTRLALVFARRHPESLRSMVLVGAVPTWAHIPSEHAPTAEHALRLLFGECRAEPACAAAFPTLEADYDRLMQTDSVDGRNPFPRTTFTDAIRTRLYEVTTSHALPLLIHNTAHGDLSTFQKEVLDKKGGAPYPDGLYLAITCSEDTMQIDDFPAQIARSQATTFGAERLLEQRRACESWPRAEIPETFFDDVVSSAPTLLISGRLDPVTPVAWAQHIASKLPHSRLVILEHGAHLPWGQLPEEALDQATLRFLDDGLGADLSPLDTLRPPPFRTK